jgi:hypothetical protein
MARFAGKYCNVKASGTGVATTGEATTDVGGVHTTYQITNAAHQVLDPQAAVTVKKNGVTQAAALYTVDRLFGRVTFLSALLGTDVVTIDATYLPMTSVAQAKAAEISVNKATMDATTFASLGDTERAHGLRDANGSVDRFTQMDHLFFTALQAGSVIVVEFWRNQTTVDWRAWALFTKDDHKAQVTDLVGETVSFETTRDADGRSVSFA